MSLTSNFTRWPRNFLLQLLGLGAWAFAQSPPAELRYHLDTGDRLVYREVFDKQGTSTDITFHSHMVFSSDLVVVASASGSSLVGIQRNRQSAELLEYRDHGKDVLALQKNAFEQRVAARPARFVDSNLFSANGQALLPLQVIREARSKLLYRINEVMPVPAAAMQVGSEWDLGIFGLRLKLEGFQTVGEESCVVVADNGNRKDFHLHLTFCPGSGRLVKLDFEGQYPEIDSNIREHVTIELESVQHHETPGTWLARADTRLGVLNAYVVSAMPLPPSAVMNEILQDGTHDAQALALAAYYHRGQVPEPQVLMPLLKSDSEEVRRLAGRFTQAPPKLTAQPCSSPVATYKPEKAGTTLRGMNTEGYTGYPYMIHVPLDYLGDQPFPLIVYLSGGGGLAFDGALTSGNTLAHAGYLVLYPHAGGDLWWQPKPTETVYALLLEVLRNYNVDTNRVYLVGFSNGGTAAFEFGTRWPDRFAAIASMMGAGLDTPSGAKLPLQNLLDVPVLFIHGDKDQRIPASASISTQNALRGLKPRVSPELHIVKGRGHDITFAEDDDFTLPFLQRSTRDPFPSAVVAKFFDSRFNRQYWIEIVPADKGAPEVEARILEGNLIDIDTHDVKKLRLLLRPELLASSGPVRIRLNGKERPAIELKRDCQRFQNSAQTYADPFLAYTDEIVLDVP